jgi:ATP-dependent Lon protease
VLGAHRAGIVHIILPRQNEADLEDLPTDVREALVFHPVANLDEVFELALVAKVDEKAAVLGPVG